MTEDIEIFKLLADLKQFKVDIYFANFGQVRIDPTCFLLFGQVPVILLVWVSYVSKNNPKPFHLTKIQEPGLRSGISYFQ